MVLKEYACSSRFLMALFIGILITSCVSAPGPSLIRAQASPYSKAVFDLSEKASTAYSENRWGDAARYYEQLTEEISNDAYIWFRLANVYVQQGSFNQAIDAYEKSIDWDSSQPKPWFNLSTTYLLNAKAAMQQSREFLRESDPARELIKTRIQVLDNLMNVGIDDTTQ